MKTIYINSFLEYENAVSEFKSTCEEGLTAVFRGTQELFVNNRHLYPSLAWKKLVPYEYELIEEIKRFHPMEFNLSGTGLLAKLQHYGVPTRLLDFTYSSYVALYFALKQQQKDNDKIAHKVYCKKMRTNNVVAETIARISEKLQPYMFDPEDNKSFVETILFSNPDADLTKLKEFFGKIYSTDIFVSPKFYTNREINQQSVFMIFCNKIKDRYNNIDFDKKYWIDSLDTSNIKGRFYFDNEFIDPKWGEDESIWELQINPNVVISMREKLNEMGINEVFLFPDDLERTSQFVSNTISNRHKIK